MRSREGIPDRHEAIIEPCIASEPSLDENSKSAHFYHTSCFPILYVDLVEAYEDTGGSTLFYLLWFICLGPQEMCMLKS